MSVPRAQISTSVTRSGSSKPSPRRPLSRRASSLLRGVVERLETRVLFNTIITDTDPLTAAQPTEIFEYKDLKGQAVRVVVHGDVSAEFVFARVTKGNDKGTAGWNDVILGEPVPAGSKEDGRDLFHVYVAQASIDSYIAIARVPDVTNRVRPMQPYEGSVTLTITPRIGTDLGKTTANGTGSIVLGTRTRTVPNIDDSGDIPIRSDNFNGQGIFPVTPGNKLVAGLSTAPGVSLGKFMFGGAVMGQVRIDGSMETFYCGALLTGVTEGQFTGTPEDRNNFHVGGDIRNILVKGSIGTDFIGDTVQTRDATYLTGVDFDIQGRVGQIKTGLDYAGTGTIYNDLPTLGLRTRQQEIEFRIPTGVNRGSFTDFENGQFGDQEGFFNNDTFATPQFLGSINSKQTGNNSVQVNGLFQWESVRLQDRADYYAVPLMAGQSISVRLIAPLVSAGFILVGGQFVQVSDEIKSDLHVGVFDPDNRLIASDYSNVTDNTNQPVDADPQQQQLFSFTADKPGIYRFAVGKDAPGFGANPGLFIIEQPYQLQITGIGNLGIGGLAATATTSDIVAYPGLAVKKDNSITGLMASIEVVHGDLGAIYSNAFITSLGGVNGIADGGDFRAIDAVSLGEVLNQTFGAGVNILALTGSVGMIRGSGTDVTNNTTQVNVFGDLIVTGSDSSGLAAIGGDVQYIVAPNTLITDLTINGSLGVIQAAQWGVSNYAGTLSVNADGRGKPGVIDLIDITGNLGTVSAGGPIISTNKGGNLRYLHIERGGEAFRPIAFGGGSNPEQTTYSSGQEVDLTDDSGAQVRVTPTQETVLDPLTGLPVFDANGNVQVNSGTITVLTYPIFRSPSGSGGGGSAIVRIASTRGVDINTAGGSVEIGEIRTGHDPTLATDPVTDNGPSLIVDSLGFDGIANTGDEDLGPDGVANSGDESFDIDPLSTNQLRVRLTGARTDVYTITGTNYREINNATPNGEIVNTNIGTVGVIQGDFLGMTNSSIRPGMSTEGSNVFDNPGDGVVEGNTFPFRNSKVAICINGGGEASPAVRTISARQALGNVCVEGIIEDANANSDNKGTKGVFEGINGALYANGQIRNVMIGEGILPSGTGDMGRAGVYVAGKPGGGLFQYSGRLFNLTNQGPGSDIRGDVVCYGGIGKIQLNGGSIINSDILVIHLEDGAINGSDLAPSREFATGAFDYQFPQSGLQNQDPGNIDSIVLSGFGGIIGTNFIARNMGPISVLGGFGIINSEFTVTAAGRFGTVTADGYGIRGAVWAGGQSIDSINVRGKGNRLSSAQFDPGVRLSETSAIDPFFGTRPSPLTDINVTLGLSKKTPVKKGVSSSGSFDLSNIGVSRDTGPITANTMKSDEINVPNNMAGITTRSYVERVTVGAGRIDNIDIGGDMTKSNWSFSGPVGSTHVGGSLKGSSSLSATGANGTIGNVIVDNTLYGNVSAEKGITSIRVGSSYGSQGTHSGGGLAQFILGGDFLSTAILDVNKTLQKLVIGGDFQDGGIIKYGVLGTTTIIGANEGDLIKKT